MWDPEGGLGQYVNTVTALSIAASAERIKHPAQGKFTASFKKPAQLLHRALLDPRGMAFIRRYGLLSHRVSGCCCFLHVAASYTSLLLANTGLKSKELAEVHKATISGPRSGLRRNLVHATCRFMPSIPPLQWLGKGNPSSPREQKSLEKGKCSMGVQPHGAFL